MGTPRGSFFLLTERHLSSKETMKTGNSTHNVFIEVDLYIFRAAIYQT